MAIELTCKINGGTVYDDECDCESSALAFANALMTFSDHSVEWTQVDTYEWSGTGNRTIVITGCGE